MKLTNNNIVIIPKIWRKIICYPPDSKGVVRTHLIAQELLAELISLYKQGQSLDLTYAQLTDRLCLSKPQIRSGRTRLEKLNLITVTSNNESDQLFWSLNIEQIKQISPSEFI